MDKLNGNRNMSHFRPLLCDFFFNLMSRDSRLSRLTGVNLANQNDRPTSQSTLRKIFIIVTTSHLLRLKCTKFDPGWGSAPDPAG